MHTLLPNVLTSSLAYEEPDKKTKTGCELKECLTQAHSLPMKQCKLNVITQS